MVIFWHNQPEIHGLVSKLSPQNLFERFLGIVGTQTFCNDNIHYIQYPFFGGHAGCVVPWSFIFNDSKSSWLVHVEKNHLQCCPSTQHATKTEHLLSISAIFSGAKPSQCSCRMFHSSMAAQISLVSKKWALNMSTASSKPVATSSLIHKQVGQAAAAAAVAMQTSL